MRIYWTEEEEQLLRYYYEEMGMSISEFYIDFIKMYPHRTKISLDIKIIKMELRHTESQKYEIKSRLNSGEKNGMFGKISPNRGLTKENSNRIKISGEKISTTRKQMFLDGLLPDISGEKNPMYGKDSWNKGKTKYTDDRLFIMGKKQSKNRIRYWRGLNQDEKDIIIGNLSLAANKAKKDTKIEIIIKDVLEKMNINFIKNYKCGRFIFDFYLIDYNFVIECQGDYWHGNPNYFKILNEIQIKNKERDKNKIKYLLDCEIKSLFLWENEIYKYKNDLKKIINENIGI